MTAEKEIQIIHDCLAGDRLAQRELYDHFSSVMFSICCRYTKDVHQAEQVLQDGFLKIFDKLDTFQHKGSFEGWLKKIMVNTCLDFLKSKINNLKKATSLYEVDTVFEKNTVQNHGSENLDQNYLLKMIQKLPPTTRAVFNMYAIEGFSHKEIAEEFNMSTGTSQWHVNQARSILKAGIESILKTEKKTTVKLAYNNL